MYLLLTFVLGLRGGLTQAFENVIAYGLPPTLVLVLFTVWVRHSKKVSDEYRNRKSE